MIAGPTVVYWGDRPGGGWAEERGLWQVAMERREHTRRTQRLEAGIDTLHRAILRSTMPVGFTPRVRQVHISGNTTCHNHHIGALAATDSKTVREQRGHAGRGLRFEKM